jgi:proline dehydrogenase
MAPAIYRMNPEPDRWTLPDWPSTLSWCRTRNSQGIRCIIDVLGEYASTKETADEAMAAYLDCITQIHDEKLKASISIKLSSVGAMFDPDLALKNALDLAKEALSKNVGFEIAMEGKQSIDLTIKVTKACAAAGSPLTMTLQAYLKRTLDDLAGLQTIGNVRYRLVKGAYVGDDFTAHTISESYMLLIEALTYLKRPFCVATHDPELLNWMKRSGMIDTGRTEFSFLKGLADNTKLTFVEKGLIVSEYVPFGKASGPYVARRMKYLQDLERLNKSPAP